MLSIPQYAYFCRDDIDWFTELPYTISVPHFDALIVHAGFVPGVALENQDPNLMYTIRTVPVKNGDVEEGEPLEYPN